MTVNERLRATARTAIDEVGRSPVPEPPTRSASRRPVLVGVGAVAALLVIVVALVVGGDQEPLTPPTTVVSSKEPPIQSRIGQSAVWSGEELLVWGGHSGDLSDMGTGVVFADGAAYDPDLDRWRPIPPAPLAAMTWHFGAWTGDEMLIVGPSGAAAYDPIDDSWRSLPSPPIEIDRPNATSVGRTEYAWSGSHLYVWKPATDELVRLDPDSGAWEQMPGPGMDVYPAKLLADEQRLMAFGTRWPSGPAQPATNDLLGARWVDGAWHELEPVDFTTSEYANVADPGTATLSIGQAVIVWGDPSPVPGDARLFHPDGIWGSVPPPPLGANTAHPRPIALADGRVLAMSEAGLAAIWEPTTLRWTPIEEFGYLIAGSEAVWTGKELLIWRGGGDPSTWVPPDPPR